MDLMTNRWGWTNGPYTAANAGVEVGELKMYAGAGQCEIPKGTEVGSRDSQVDGITVTVTFTPTAMMYRNSPSITSRSAATHCNTP